MVHDHAVLEDHGLVAYLLDVAQQVGADEHIHPLLVLHLLDELEHAAAGGGIEAIGRFVQHHQLGPVHDRLGELRHLLHPIRVGPQLPVPRLSESHMKQHLVRLFERRVRREARQFGHLTQERHGRHLPDERVVLRHVADVRTVHVAAAVESQDAGASAARPEKSEEGEEQAWTYRRRWGRATPPPSRGQTRRDGR